MPLYKNGKFHDDPWTIYQARSDLIQHAPLLITLEDWQQNKSALQQHKAGLGIQLASDQSPDLIADDISNFILIALTFPKFTDGRAYSYARIIRERYGFRGEIRAVGNVLRDQLSFMLRCGFDSISLPERAISEAWTDALIEISITLQPAFGSEQSEIVGDRGDQHIPSRKPAIRPEKPSATAQGSF